MKKRVPALTVVLIAVVFFSIFGVAVYSYFNPVPTDGDVLLGPNLPGEGGDPSGKECDRHSSYNSYIDYFDTPFTCEGQICGPKNVQVTGNNVEVRTYFYECVEDDQGIYRWKTLCSKDRWTDNSCGTDVIKCSLDTPCGSFPYEVASPKIVNGTVRSDDDCKGKLPKSTLDQADVQMGSLAEKRLTELYAITKPLDDKINALLAQQPSSIPNGIAEKCENGNTGSGTSGSSDGGGNLPG